METKDLVVVDDNDMPIIDKMHKLFKNMMSAHSEFQIRNFILNDFDFPTDAGKYHQCVRELYSRYDNLINLSHEYKKTQHEIEIAEIQKERLLRNLSKASDDLDIREINSLIKMQDIEIEHKMLRIESIKKNASESIREMRVFMDVVETIDKYIPNEFRDANGLPDKEKSELEFWVHRQMVCEQMSEDPNRTPFNRILGLKANEPAKIVKDQLGRFVIMSAEDAKKLEEQMSRLQLEQNNKKLLEEVKNAR